MSEQTLSMPQAARLFPSRHPGRDRVTTQTLVNWILRGKHGVRLEGVYTPQGWLTSREAVGRFLGRLDAHSGRVPPAGQSDYDHEVAEAAADAVLKAAGVIP